MTVWRLDTGGSEADSKDAVKMVRKQRYNLGAISLRKAEEMQIEALKEATRSQRKCMAKRISFPQWTT